MSESVGKFDTMDYVVVGTLLVLGTASTVALVRQIKKLKEREAQLSETLKKTEEEHFAATGEHTAKNIRQNIGHGSVRNEPGMQYFGY